MCKAEAVGQDIGLRKETGLKLIVLGHNKEDRTRRNYPKNPKLIWQQTEKGVEEKSKFMQVERKMKI